MCGLAVGELSFTFLSAPYEVQAANSMWRLQKAKAGGRLPQFY
jgi:hypothetical protein